MDNSEGLLDSFLNKNKLPIGMGVVGLVLLIGGVISSGIIPKTFVKSSKSLPQSTTASINQSSFKVDVSGAVVNPGVYTLAAGARIEDAIKAAGGVTTSADPTYMSKTINLAQKITDGVKIYIPPVQESGQSVVQTVAGAQEVNLINVNTASLSELDILPGVGPVSAQAIIDKRPYSGIEELLTKKAVTRSTYDKIKGLVSVY